MPRADEDRCHVAIVGGGPVGIELAWALSRQGIDYRHFEAGQIGQTMSWWAPGTRWFSSNERISLCGIPLVTPDQSKATREDYLAYLRQIVLAFGLHIRTHEPATNAERHGDGTFTLITAPRGGSVRRTRCEKLVLATGGTDFPRTLGIEGEDLPHVDGYLREPHRYFGRRVFILGGRNSAVEAALRCYHAGAQVSLAYRRERLPEQSIKYWLLPEIKSLLKSGRITPHLGAIARRITPTHVTLERCACVIEEGHVGSGAGGRRDDHVPPARFEPTGERFEVEADEVLKLVGYEQDKRLFRRCGVELVGAELRPVFDERTMETNVPGLYVAGTAVGGTQQRFRVFLENCHVHVPRIVNHVVGRTAIDEQSMAEHVALQPES